MEYNNLYGLFKEKFNNEKILDLEKENLIDDTDGMHVVFGMVVVPYILDQVKSGNQEEIENCFQFIEEMAESEDKDIQELLDFTVLEQFADEGHDVLNLLRKYMGEKTLEHCEKITDYFY